MTGVQTCALPIYLDGNPPTAGAVLKRTLARYVPLEALTFLINVGFHDSISRTKVVRTR